MVATRARGAAVSARDDVLARIRAANASGGPRPGGPGTAESGEPLRRAYRQRGGLSNARLVALFADRVADYRAKVRRTTAAGLASEIGAALEERGACRVVIPAGLDLPALPAGIELILDQDLPANVLDGCDGVITGAARGGSPGRGDRRDGDNRARRITRPGPACDNPGSRLPPVHRARRPGRSAGRRGTRGPVAAAAAHLDQRSVRDQ